MSKTFNNIDELSKYINNQMLDVLKNEVADKVREVEAIKIDEQVYRKYRPSTSDGEPWQHERRRDNGGLRDKRNMQITSQSIDKNGASISIENMTKGVNGYRIDEIVEYGQSVTNGYEYTTNRDDTAYQYLDERPFTEKTVESLQKSNEHVDSFIKGMKRKGINIK